MHKRLPAFCIFLCLCLPTAAFAARWDVSVPLQDGRLDIIELRDTLQSALHLSPAAVENLPEFGLTVDLRGASGWLLMRAVNDGLGNAFHLSATNDALNISIDPEKLPRGWQQSCDALNRFTQTATPDATARQIRRFGLHLPQTVDSHAPLVILIHGLDGDCASCADLASLLQRKGYQTATFAYPAERPLEENAELLARHMRALREQFPDVRVDLVTESMGGLIARRYVEGPDYAGGVDRFILIAPPNAGSSWIGAGFILKLIANAGAWKNDPDWSPAWMITEGICQESQDLHPKSDFLQNLNAHPRRPDVRYTIIAGDRPAAYRYEANLLAIPGEFMDGAASQYWGVRQALAAIANQQQRLLSRSGADDGPVTLRSARLAGVADFVAVPADHLALFESVNGQPPAAWPVIEDRLAH